MCLFLHAQSAHALDKVISGQVRDDKNKLIQSVKVELWTKDGSVAMVTRTDANGKFSFTHQPCEQCFLEVAAPKRSGLASALVDGIPGDEGRSVIVTLKRGFPVTGRVISEGKGLKGIIVKAYSANHERDLKARTYGGGACESGRGGYFSMTLTFGDKRIVLLNNKYKALAKHTEIDAKVITDTDLGDVEIPFR